MRLYLTAENIKSDVKAVSKGERDAKGRPVRQRVYTDTELEGFGLLVGQDAMTFFAQRTVKGKSVRIALGRHGNGRTPDHFRELAKTVLGQLGKANMAANPDAAADLIGAVRKELVQDHGAPLKRAERFDGPEPAPEPTPEPVDTRTPAERMTLAEAMQQHFRYMANNERSPRTQAAMEDEMGRFLGDWLNRPLGTIRTAEAVDRHAAIADKRTTDANGRPAGGHTQANRVFRMFRAVYNTAAFHLDDPAFPSNPVRARFPWKKEKPRKAIPWPKLPAWAAKVNGLSNPIRRDLLWTILLCGFRNEDARTIRWEHVNLGRAPIVVGDAEVAPNSIHRPKPKGGEDRAYTVPLSSTMVELLKRRREENRILFGDDRGWVFPSRDNKGNVTHVKEAKVQDYVKGADGKLSKRTALPSPHRLRHTFSSAGHDLCIPRLVVKILMNHVKTDADITDRYTHPGDDALRDAAERIAAFLIGKAGAKPATTPITRQTAGRIGAAQPPAGRIVPDAAGKGERRQASA